MKIEKLPGLAIKNFALESAIFQGGMGVGVSLKELAGAVSAEGGLGILSSAGLKTLVSEDEKSAGRSAVDTYTAVRMQVEQAKEKSGGKPVGINIMFALQSTYEDSVRAAIDGGADAIISGAGLPLGLPGIQKPGNTALIPIVSSARALEIIIKRWERVGYRPDAVVLEGPLAGGHLGFKIHEVDDPEFALEKLLQPVLELAAKNGNIPVIVAGGIYTNEDIVQYLAMGASGVQMGTRFLATHESGASKEYKEAVVAAGKDDITVAAYPENDPASPCGLPFRVLKCSPMFRDRGMRTAKCNRGYVLQRGVDGKLSQCAAMPGSPHCEKFLCICNGLLSSAGYAAGEPPLYTVGTNAYRVDRILSVSELMAELRGPR